MTPISFLVRISSPSFLGGTHNIYFISEKWKTIRHTRRLAFSSMFSSIVLLSYIAVYAEAQRYAEDWKEYRAVAVAN